MSDPPLDHTPIAQDGDSPDIVWRPTPEYIKRSRLKWFMDAHGIGSVAELVARSTADVAWFWEAVVRDLGIEWFRPYERVLDLAGGIEWPRWFVGGGYNYVHDAVDKQAHLRPETAAVIWEA